MDTSMYNSLLGTDFEILYDPPVMALSISPPAKDSSQTHPPSKLHNDTYAMLCYAIHAPSGLSPFFLLGEPWSRE